MKDLPNNAFLSKCRLWDACNKGGEDGLRPALEYVFFENGYAYASNAHILVRVPITHVSTLADDSLSLLEGHGIHGPLLKRLVHLWPLRVEKEDIIDKDGNEREMVYIYAYDGENEIRVTLTNTEQIKPPRMDEMFEITGEREPVHKVGLSQKMLNRLTSALGTTKIKMEFVSEKTKILVTPLEVEHIGAEGLIMPMIVTGTIEGFS